MQALRLKNLLCIVGRSLEALGSGVWLKSEGEAKLNVKSPPEEEQTP